ncbi:NAD-dependent epimerase/dehydratase family protein [Streptomyces lonarensis]|uniref:NAD-dependent epimerase/dehydratase family protein n=1 Tax=Streptomyces lonarensis TaxID=700599 RepID=A0A7X6HZM6_9ACTN|nr:NAD-dependent epimerase/dehydratase family protein [Streptomyces lonarensis]NJQ06404.1 NAD-dependent epimerase/dehydratase family protein [Streptomyces lonarensis]
MTQQQARPGLRVVVVGATGNIGSAVVEALGRDDRIGSVLGIARRPTSWRPAGTDWETADIGAHGSVPDLVDAFRGADVVIHTAWLIQPSRDTAVTWATNVLGTARVLRAVALAEVPALLYASSVAAYSPRRPGERPAPADENHPTHGWPTVAYSREKAYVERLLDVFELRNPGTRVVRMRPGFVFRRAAAMEQRRLFAGPLVPHRLVRSALVPAVPLVPGVVLQTVHARDVADGFLRAALRQEARGAYNLAAEPPLTTADFAALFDAPAPRVPYRAVRAAQALAYRARAVPSPPQLLDALRRLPVMSTERARSELGWRPTVGAADAVAEMLAGLRDAAGGPTAPLRERVPGGRAREVATGVGRRDDLPG